MGGRLFGDPKSLANRIVDKEFDRVTSNIEEAYSTSLQILRDAYNKALRRLEDELKEKLTNLRERVASERATLELNLRHRVAIEKSTAIDSVLRDAVSVLLSEKSGEWYKNYLESAIGRALSEMPHGDVKVRVSPDDKSIVEEIISSKYPRPGIQVVEDPMIRGGVIAESADGLTRSDYSLDLVIRSVESALRAKASRELFGE
ncbi:MAG: V-type ATP synthase subunit E [Desulfurococcales archaeon]|nr:V-type ATP synthase subunit E [Desulfurococcales archaeon]